MSDSTAAMAFMEGAIKQVALVGIENLRTKNVAEETKYSEATLFREFKTKDDLLCRTFLEVDKRISRILSDSKYIETIDSMNVVEFYTAAHRVWQKAYRYLIEHQDETLFTIRFRYCSLYSDELRNKRQAYNGNFNRAYKIMEKCFNEPASHFSKFLVNYAFELTLCFAEKIIKGRVENTKETENYIWTVIKNATEAYISYRNLVAEDDSAKVADLPEAI